MEIGWQLTMTAILPWAATRGDATRAARTNFICIFAVGGFDF